MKDDGNGIESETQEEGGQQTRLSLNFKTALDRNQFNDAIELVMRENNVKKNEAVGIVTALLQKQLAVEGYGAGRPDYTNQYYNLIEAQARSLLTGFRNALENCDEGVLAIQTECNRQIEQLKGELESQKIAHADAMAELSEHNSQLESSNAELADENSHLKKENEALAALKNAYDKAAAAWETEKQTLNEKIVSLQAVVEENTALLKERETLKAEIGDLKTEMADKQHRFEIESKEAEIRHQRLMAETVAAKAAAAEEKSKQYFEPIVSDLKNRLSETTEQLQAERKNVDAVRAEERAKASEAIERLEDLLRQAQALAMSGSAATEPKKKSSPRKPTTP